MQVNTTTTSLVSYYKDKSGGQYRDYYLHRLNENSIYYCTNCNILTNETHHYIIFSILPLHSKPGMESYC